MSLVSSDEELPGQSNIWCLLLEAAYHHSIGGCLPMSMCHGTKAVLSQTCHFALFVNPVARASTDLFLTLCDVHLEHERVSQAACLQHWHEQLALPQVQVVSLRQGSCFQGTTLQESYGSRDRRAISCSSLNAHCTFYDSLSLSLSLSLSSCSQSKTSCWLCPLIMGKDERREPCVVCGAERAVNRVSGASRSACSLLQIDDTGNEQVVFQADRAPDAECDHMTSTLQHI